MSRPTLHVEVVLQNTSQTFVRTAIVRDEVSRWLVEAFSDLQVSQSVTGYDELEHGSVIIAINVVDITGNEQGNGVYSLQDVRLDVQAFELHDEHKQSPRRTIKQTREESENPPAMRVTILPSQQLHWQWDSLVFDDAIPARLLRFITRMVALSRDTAMSITPFSRLVLLYGPPGTGKTTLCRVLAQKITIRLSQRFASGKLVEINANALLSKWFSESGKLVSKAFDEVYDLAQQGTSLICVLLDEVESLAGNRESSTAGADSRDGLRATNQLLTALDRLRTLPNIVVLCTSNLIGVIDPAFLDRVDVKQYIPPPQSKAVYGILRSVVNDLLRSGHITSERKPATSECSSPPSTQGSSNQALNSSLNQDMVNDWDIVRGSTIPSLSELGVLFLNKPQSPGRRVWAVAQKCSGLSGRIIRRLPFLALAMYTNEESCSLKEALTALDQAAEIVAGKEGSLDTMLA